MQIMLYDNECSMKLRRVITGLTGFLQVSVGKFTCQKGEHFDMTYNSGSTFIRTVQ